MECWEVGASPEASCEPLLPDESAQDEPSIMAKMRRMSIEHEGDGEDDGEDEDDDEDDDEDEYEI